MKIRVTFPLPRANNRGFSSQARHNDRSIQSQIYAPNSDAVAAIKDAASSAAGPTHSVVVEHHGGRSVVKIMDMPTSGNTRKKRDRKEELRAALARVRVPFEAGGPTTRWMLNWDKRARRAQNWDGD